MCIRASSHTAKDAGPPCPRATPRVASLPSSAVLPETQEVSASPGISFHQRDGLRELLGAECEQCRSCERRRKGESLGRVRPSTASSSCCSCFEQNWGGGSCGGPKAGRSVCEVWGWSRFAHPKGFLAQLTCGSGGTQKDSGTAAGGCGKKPSLPGLKEHLALQKSTLAGVCFPHLTAKEEGRLALLWAGAPCLEGAGTQEAGKGHGSTCCRISPRRNCVWAGISLCRPRLTKGSCEPIWQRGGMWRCLLTPQTQTGRPPRSQCVSQALTSQQSCKVGQSQYTHFISRLSWTYGGGWPGPLVPCKNQNALCSVGPTPK